MKLLLLILILFLAPTAALAQAALDPCQAVSPKVSVPISQAASAQLVTQASGTKKLYVCAMVFIVADAEDISLVEGTGSVCGSNTAAVIGGTTAANGMNIGAGGGIAQGNGLGTVAAGHLAGGNACLLQSGTGRVSGVMTYVLQ